MTPPCNCYDTTLQLLYYPSCSNSHLITHFLSPITHSPLNHPSITHPATHHPSGPGHMGSFPDCGAGFHTAQLAAGSDPLCACLQGGALLGHCTGPQGSPQDLVNLFLTQEPHQHQRFFSFFFSFFILFFFFFLSFLLLLSVQLSFFSIFFSNRPFLHFFP